ncbi:acyltransferase [Niabella ginsengisoli]|uniref:Acyltransferase n=1 Tax=Niabella ginsengisoli TaxID=522298 RepID=A0ABS9SK16_9BACT|nr:hypothetical protein [Niabella ginsengisoli]MCH5598732.1 hypothetical protein [Niabella ginsengisoli]
MAHNSTILSSSHTWDDRNIPIKYNQLVMKKTVIKDDVWIGCGVRILSNICVNSRSIIASGAVVTKDVPSNVIVAGLPAKQIKTI